MTLILLTLALIAAVLLIFTLSLPSVEVSRARTLDKAGGYAALESFLDEHPDLECSWCGRAGYHEIDCELVATAAKQRGGRCLT